jgi:hypothetical protein
LFANGRISRSVALEHVANENDFEQYLRRVHGSNQDRLDPLDPLDPLNPGTV